MDAAPNDNVFRSLDSYARVNIKLQPTDEDGVTPTTTYNIIADDVVVGTCELRQHARKSAALPPGFESNLYLEVYPEFQRKGYGTATLRHLLHEAHAVGMKKVSLNISDDDIASQKIMETYGAVIVEEANTTEARPIFIRHYEISII